MCNITFADDTGMACKDWVRFLITSQCAFQSNEIAQPTYYIQLPIAPQIHNWRSCDSCDICPRAALFSKILGFAGGRQALPIMCCPGRE